ncbi:hypothetical protein [Haloflavibacter putidus]|uniref:Uncharacterized protein n=1 Tax=Haloflavibacter putidus TaxID=2576776 RepID=A0A507ZP02_9FLAO|nr:hypothetical protein [Haloflavibacter putidus]TQD39019.1 hypothetical protein FKR84_06370 [Haloflavibacter putidus]
MGSFVKVSLLKNVVFAAIFAGLYFSLQAFSKMEQTYVLIIAAFAAVLLSPRLRKTQTSEGEKIQLFWLNKKVYEA